MPLAPAPDTKSVLAFVLQLTHPHRVRQKRIEQLEAKVLQLTHPVWDATFGSRGVAFFITSSTRASAPDAKLFSLRSSTLAPV